MQLRRISSTRLYLLPLLALLTVLFLAASLGCVDQASEDGSASSTLSRLPSLDENFVPLELVRTSEETAPASLRWAVLRKEERGAVLRKFLEVPTAAYTINLLSNAKDDLDFRDFRVELWFRPALEGAQLIRLKALEGSESRVSFDLTAIDAESRAQPGSFRLSIRANDDSEVPETFSHSFSSSGTNCEPSPTRARKESIDRPVTILCPGQEIVWDSGSAEKGTLQLHVALVDPVAQAATQLEISAGPRTVELKSVDSVSVQPSESERWVSRQIEVRKGHRHFRFVSNSSQPLAINAVKRSSSPNPDLPNLVLISIDTLRADRMSIYGHDEPTTPALEQWFSQGGLVFDDAVAASPWTLPSHTSMFTGVSPLVHGINYTTQVVPEATLTLAERLAAQGYTTVALTGGGFLDPKFGLNQGFDEYLSWEESEGTELTSNLEALLSRLDQIPQPFFLFFHTYEVHSPHRSRPGFETLFPNAPPSNHDVYSIVTDKPTPEDGFRTRVRVASWKGNTLTEITEFEELRRYYDSGVRFADRHIGELLNSLDGTFSEARTVVLLTSDHGEALGERNLGGHAYLYDFNLAIPFLLRDSADPVSGLRRTSLQVSLEDVAPTLLSFAGLSFGGMEGRNLTPLLADRRARVPFLDTVSVAAASNHGVSARRLGKEKYIFYDIPWLEPDRRHEVYSLPQEIEDPLLEPPSEELSGPLLEKLAARPGLHLALSASDVSDLSLSLQSVAVNPSQVKIANLGCPQATFAAPDRLQMTLEAGAKCHLVLPHWNSESLAYTFESSCGTATGHLSLEPGESTAAVPICSGRNVPSLLAWSIDGALGSAASTVLSEELKKQLEALGYL